MIYRVKTENTVFEGYEDDAIKYLVGYLGLIPHKDFDAYDPIEANGCYSSNYGTVTVEVI